MTDKLIYFGARCRAEPVRMLMRILDQPLEEERINSLEEWKSRKSEFPLKQIPVMITSDGLTLNQSTTIYRYIAKKHGMVGTTPRHELFNDMFIENSMAMLDFIAPIYRWQFAGAEKPSSDMDAYKQRCREHWLNLSAAAQEHAEKYGGRYLNGDDIQMCDIALYCMMEASSFAIPDVMQLTDWLQGFVSRFQNEERVKAYLATRPPSPNGL